MYIKLFLIKLTEDEALSYSDENNTVTYKLNQTEVEDFANNYVERINESCNTLLDLFDSDYLDTNKCIKLKEFIDNNKNELMNSKHANIFMKLEEYANIAIEKNTGILIDL